MKNINILQTIPETQEILQQSEIVKQNENIQKQVWEEFGSYISRNLKGGRAVKVINFGVFTFCYPEVTLSGVTASDIHDKKERQPIFLINKDFIKGQQIKQGISTNQGIRPASFFGLTGQIQTQQINYYEIACQVNTSKEVVKYSLQNVFKNIEEQMRKSQLFSFDIPQVGQLLHKNGIVSIQFEPFLIQQIKNIFSKPLQEQILKRSRSTLTRNRLNQLAKSSSTQNFTSKNNLRYLKTQNLHQNLDNFSNFSNSQCELFSDANSWLQKNLGFTFNSSESQFINNDFKSYSNRLNNYSHFGSSCKSNFTYRTSDSFFTPGDLIYRSFQRFLHEKNIGIDGIEDAIKKMYQKQNFSQAQIQQSQVDKAQFNKFLEIINYQIPQSKQEILYKYIDKQNVGYISFNQLKELSISHDQDIQIKDLALNATRNNLDVKQIINIVNKEMKLSGNDKDLNKESLTNKISQKDQFDMQLVDRVIELIIQQNNYRQKNNLAQKINFSSLKNLQLTNANQQNWLYNMHAQLLNQIKIQNQDIQYLERKIKKYQLQDIKKENKNQSNNQNKICQNNQWLTVNQSQNTSNLCSYKNLKEVLKLYFINISNSDLNRYLSLLPQKAINNQNFIILNRFLEQLFQILYMQRDFNYQPLTNLAIKLEKYLKDYKLDSSDFICWLYKQEKDNKQSENYENKRIINAKFARYIHKYITQDLSPSYLEQLVVAIDIDQDGYIDKYDIDAFITKYIVLNSKQEEKYDNISKLEKQGKGSALNYQEKMNLIKKQQDFQKLNQTIKELNEELQKLIKMRKISYFELFQILDQNNDGIITRDEFINNLEKAVIVDWNYDIKNKYYDAMDFQRIGIVDYQRFLDMMNNHYYTSNQGDNFEWQINIIKEMQEFFIKEHVQPQEAFKLVDMDFDGIISKRDLLSFLKNVIHVPETQLSEVNINRLYKLLDKFKRQKILQGDFIELIFESSSKQIQNINSNNNTQLFNSPMEISSKNQSMLYTGKLIENQKGKIPLPISINNLTQAKSVTQQSLSAVFNTDINKNQNKFSLKQQTNLDWKSNAIKQIGFYLVRNYGDDIQQSFETITNMGQKLLFSIFKEWLQQNKVLQGLELTNNLLQQLFSELDAHKKGYLSKQDWINVFGKINKNDLTYQEIKDVLNQHFSSPYDAFQNLLFYGQKNLQKQNKENKIQKIQDKLLNFDAFYNSISLQIPNRFNKDELLNYWKFLTAQNEGTQLQGSLTYKQFVQVFYKHYSIPNTSIFSQRQLENKGPLIDSSGILILENNKQSVNKYHVTNYLNKIKYSNYQNDTVDVIEKLKRLLRSSDTPNLVKHFEKFDSQKCGKLTNLDFRLALRELHLSLSQTDLDQCLIIAKTEQGGFVDYYDFIKKITPGDLQALIIKRAKAYLEKIREEIYRYMFSPKDAFRQYNSSQNGQMTISEFQNFLNKLSQISSSSITPYSLMRDVFDFIDIRNDGVIDLHEWMESFRKLDSQTSQQRLDEQMGKVQEENQVLNNDLQLTQGFDIKQFDWECTKDYDQALKIIGINRKPLLKEFQKKEQQTKQKITFSEAKTILQNLLSQYMQLSEKNYNSLIRFAEKNGCIEYQFMFDVYKNRLQQINNQPQNYKINQIRV